jgi:hypothetical protein
MNENKTNLKEAHTMMREDGAGVVEIGLISPCEAIDDPAVLTAVVGWAKHIVQHQPLCLLCDHVWTSLSQLPPRLLAIARPRCDHPRAVIVSGVCNACVENSSSRDELLAATVERYKRLWPDMRTVEYAHKPSTTMQ